MRCDEWIEAFETAAKKLGMAKADVAEAVEYYREAIEDRMEEGMGEEDVVAALGSIEEETIRCSGRKADSPDSLVQLRSA